MRVYASIVAFCVLLLCAGSAHAQYVPIPNEQSGAQCPGSIDQCSGFKIRADINAKFSALGANDCQWTATGGFQCTKINGAPIATGFATGLTAQNAIPINQVQPSDGQCLKYQASSNKFVFAACGGNNATGLTFGTTTLTTASTAPTNGQCLQSNGTQIVGGNCGAGGGVPGGSQGQPQFNTGANTFGGSGAVLYADAFSGATWDAKITNAIAALPAGGGTIDARGLCPSPTGPAAANLTLGSQSQPVQLLLGPCTYALGAHQIKYFNQTKILGTTGTNSTAGSVISFTGSGTAIIGGISSGANIYGIDFENFTVSGDTTTGSTGFDLTYIFQGTVEKVSTIGTDIGGTLGGTGTCACYNIFPQDDFNGISFGFKLGQTANQDSFYGGSAVASVGDGYDLNQSSTDYFYDVDSESDGNSAIHLESNTGTVGIFGGYFENANKGILLDSGSNNNYIVGVGAVINITDNSGATNNYYNWLGAEDYWPLNFAVQQGLYFGRSIRGTGTNSWLYLTAGADGPMSLINQLLNAQIYGLYGHGGIVVGSIQNTSGVQDTGLLSVNILNYNNAVTATKVGATGSTTYGPYYVVCHDANGGVSPDPNASNTITNGAATLTSSNYIQVTWNVLDGCKTWDILRGDQSHSVAVNVQVPTNSGQSQHVYQDQSNSTSAYSLPARNTTGDATIAGNVTAAQVIAPIVVTAPQTATYSSSSATFNAANGSEATLTISANVTITLSGCTAGQHLFLRLKYTGSFTPTFAVGGSDTLNFNGNGAPTFTAANNKADIIGFDCQSNGSGIDYDALPASLGYSH